MSRNKIRLWMLASIVISLSVAPFLVQGDQATQKKLEKNRQTIASMTLSERDRLDRNFQAYQQLTTDDVNSLKNFHAKLEQDRAEHAGQLSNALNTYYEWLGTIQPYQRDRLKQTSDPEERVALIHEIMSENSKREANRFMKEAYRDSQDPILNWWKSRLRSVPVLNESDLARLMDGLQQIENEKISLADKAKLAEKQGVAKYLLLLNLIRDHTNTRGPDAERRRSMVLPQFQQCFTELAVRFDTFVEDSQARDFIHSTEVDDEQSSQETPDLSLRIQGLILKSLLVQADTQNKSADATSSAELEAIFAALPEEKQDELLQLEAMDFYNDLRKLSVESVDSMSVIQPLISKERFEMLQRFARFPYPPPLRDGRFRGDDRERSDFRGPRGGDDARPERDERSFGNGRPFDRDGRPPRDGEPGRGRDSRLQTPPPPPREAPPER